MRPSRTKAITWALVYFVSGAGVLIAVFCVLARPGRATAALDASFGDYIKQIRTTDPRMEKLTDGEMLSAMFVFNQMGEGHDGESAFGRARGRLASYPTVVQYLIVADHIEMMPWRYHTTLTPWLRSWFDYALSPFGLLRLYTTLVLTGTGGILIAFGAGSLACIGPRSARDTVQKTPVPHPQSTATEDSRYPGRFSGLGRRHPSPAGRFAFPPWYTLPVVLGVTSAGVVILTVAAIIIVKIDIAFGVSESLLSSCIGGLVYFAVHIGAGFNPVGIAAWVLCILQVIVLAVL